MNFPIKGRSAWFITRKSTWSIRKTERHDEPFEQAFPSFESSLPFVTGVDTNLVVTAFKVELREDLRRADLIK